MITSTAGGVLVDVHVIPRAGTSGVAGTRGGALLVRLNAPPVEGAANAELIELLAKTLGVAKRAVTIVSGERSRQEASAGGGDRGGGRKGRLGVNGGGGGNG